MRKQIARIDIFVDPDNHESSVTGGASGPGHYTIDINGGDGAYAVRNMEDLRTTLAHELGHVISLLTYDESHAPKNTFAARASANGTHQLNLPAERKAWEFAHLIYPNLDPTSERLSLQTYEDSLALVESGQASKYGFAAPILPEPTYDASHDLARWDDDGGALAALDSLNSDLAEDSRETGDYSIWHSNVNLDEPISEYAYTEDGLETPVYGDELNAWVSEPMSPEALARLASLLAVSNASRWHDYFELRNPSGDYSQPQPAPSPTQTITYASGEHSEWISYLDASPDSRTFQTFLDGWRGRIPRYTTAGDAEFYTSHRDNPDYFPPPAPRDMPIKTEMSEMSDNSDVSVTTEIPASPVPNSFWMWAFALIFALAVISLAGEAMDAAAEVLR